MRKGFLFLAFAFVICALPLSAQNYVYGAKYKFYTQANVNSGNGYRTLRLQTKSDSFIDNVGVMDLVKAHTPGNPNIVEILEVTDPKDKYFNKNAKIWKKGEKTTIDALRKDDKNVTGYRIRTPGNGFWVEFTGTGYQGMFDRVDNRKFGVIMPNSDVRVYSGGGSVWVDSGAIGWDDEFMYANNLEDYMKYLAQKVDYNTVKTLSNKAKFDSLKTDDEKRKYCAELVSAIATGAGVWGAVWGAAPPWLLPLEFANVLAQFTAQAYMASVIGYLHGYYPNGGSAFQQQLKLDNYMLYAGSSAGAMTADTLKGMGGTARDEAIQKAATAIMTKIAPKAPKVAGFTLRSIPILGTVWGVGSGAYSGVKDAVEMGTRAYLYYSKPQREFSFDTLARTITRYNGKNGNVEKNVTIPARIDNINVEKIKADAFANKTTVESVTLGENLKTIEANAFKNCTSLKTITLHNNIRNIDIKAGAFSGCGQLATVRIPSDIISLVEQKRTTFTIGANAFNGTKLDDNTKIALRKLGYYGAGVGAETIQPGIIVQNNTGAAIGIIERKNGSSWTSLSTRNVGNGSKSEVINLTPGNYEIRIRAAGSDPFNPKTAMYLKKDVKTYANTTTPVTFTTNDKYWTRKEYQDFIQARCKFGNQQAVWNAMNTHPNADDLYRVWAQSYPATSDYRYPNPRTGYTGIEADQKIIQAQCKFGNQQAVWNTAAKHANPPTELLKKWADSYYNGSQAVAPPTATNTNTNKNTNTNTNTNTTKPPTTNTTTTTTTNTSKPTNADYQRTIQSRCGYQTQTDVWKAIDKITPAGNRDRVYKAWGESYNRSKPSSSQRSKSDKDLILDMCPDIKGISDSVWKTIEANFANYNGLYKKWADSYRNM
jgi:hypothetical protein